MRSSSVRGHRFGKRRGGANHEAARWVRFRRLSRREVSQSHRTEVGNPYPSGEWTDLGSDSGIPARGPLSPFLSNVVLDEWDKEVKRRGHCFVRYVDDCNIYVKSHRAGERVMASATRFITQRLKLQVNESKSAEDVPSNRHFLGFTLTTGRHKHRRKFAPKSLLRFKAKVRQLTNRDWRNRMDERIDRLSSYLRLWRSYFGFAEATTVLRDLDSWVRRRLRCARWSQWKTYRRGKAELLRLGVPKELALKTAWSAKGPWRVYHSPGVQRALSVQYFDDAGLPRLYAR